MGTLKKFLKILLIQINNLSKVNNKNLKKEERKNDKATIQIRYVKFRYKQYFRKRIYTI